MPWRRVTRSRDEAEACEFLVLLPLLHLLLLLHRRRHPHLMQWSNASITFPAASFYTPFLRSDSNFKPPSGSPALRPSLLLYPKQQYQVPLAQTSSSSGLGALSPFPFLRGARRQRRRMAYQSGSDLSTSASQPNQTINLTKLSPCRCLCHWA